MIEVDLTPLPTTFSLLVNLLTLCLEDCLLDDLDAIGEMKKLKILSFQGCLISKLPVTMCQLTGMRLLDLRDCRNLTGFPSEILLSLTGIEALYMNSDSDEIVSDEFIDVLNHLTHLVILEMITLSTNCGRRLIMSKLIRYRITIGHRSHSFVGEPSSISRVLMLGRINPDECNISQMSEVEALQVAECKGTDKSLLLDMNGTGFPKLVYLKVDNDFGRSCILSSVSSAVFPVLEYLELSVKLEKICDSSFAPYSLLNLKEIKVGWCRHLRNIFCFSSSVGVLPNLTKMEVLHCEDMKEIFTIEEQGDSNSTYDIINLKKLSHLTLNCLPAFKGFCGLTNIDIHPNYNIFSTDEPDYSLSLFDEKVLYFLCQKAL